MTPEQFLLLTDPLPEPMLLLSSDGLIRAANRASQERLGLLPQELQGTPLADLAADPPDTIAHYLQSCAQSRRMVPGTLVLRSNGDGIACRTEGTLLHPGTEQAEALLMVRLTPEDPGSSQFVALNQRIEELGREILRRSQAETAARAEQERLRVTLQSIGDAVIVADPEGRVMSMNPVAESLTGWKNEEAVGCPLERVFEIRNEKTRLPVENPALRALRENARMGLSNHTVLIARDGTERPIDDCAAPIQDAHGAVIGAVLVFRDISERRRLEQQKSGQLHAARLLAAIVESSDDAIVSKTLDGIIRSWNAAAERLFGYTPEQAIGRHITLIIPAERIAEEDQIIARLRAGQRIDHFDTVRVRSDGRPVHVSLTISPVRDDAGRVIGASKIARDVTERKRMEEALKASEAQFRQLANAMPQIVWAARPDGYVDYYNDRWYEYTGLPRGEYGQLGWERALHPDDVGRSLDTYFHCIRHGTPYQIEYRFKDRRTDGYRWFLGRAMPVRNEQGEIVRWFGTCTDIDDTKQAEQKAQFLADASAELAMLTDPDSTMQRLAAAAVPGFADWCAVDLLDDSGARRRLPVTHIDPTRARLAEQLRERYPMRADDAHGLAHVLRTGKAELLEEIPDALLVEAAHDADHLHLLRELGLKSSLCVPMLLRGRILGVLSFVMAWSGRRFETADLRVAEELAHRAAVAIENANLYRELQREDRRKTEFLAVLAHELRNPLAPLRNGLQVLRMAGDDPEAVEETRTMMVRQLQHLVRLVDDLLDVSRISRGKIQLRKERLNLAVVVSSALETCAPMIEQQNDELTVTLPEEPVYVDADRTRLAQALCNLVNNAAKYSDRGSPIRLTVRREGHEAVLSVKDTGVGIPAAMLPRVFDLFTQVDRTLEKAQGGLGVGLSIVKRLIELHGGKVEAHSEGPGMGSEFTIRLPVVEAAKHLKQLDGGEGVSRPAARFRVLVADDNLDAANSLALMLRFMGSEVRTVHDGLSALETAAAFKPDMIVLDIGMPKLNGYDTCRLIREQPWGKDVLLAALTGWGQDEDRRRSREVGFDEHLVKPIEPEMLEKLLARVKTRTA